jgi:hypothetical protein
MDPVQAGTKQTKALATDPRSISSAFVQAAA